MEEVYLSLINIVHIFIRLLIPIIPLYLISKVIDLSDIKITGKKGQIVVGLGGSGLYIAILLILFRFAEGENRKIYTVVVPYVTSDNAVLKNSQMKIWQIPRMDRSTPGEPNKIRLTFVVDNDHIDVQKTIAPSGYKRKYVNLRDLVKDESTSIWSLMDFARGDKVIYSDKTMVFEKEES